MEVSWDGFNDNFRKELDWFWRDQRTLTDVTIFCDGGAVRAHKLVLALASPYFHNMCIETQVGCTNSVISLSSVNLEDFKIILEYMYRGRVVLNDACSERIVRLAKSLYVRGFGAEKRIVKNRVRSGSLSSAFADSDIEDEFEERERQRIYIRPEEIAMDNLPPNRVTRASLATRESPKRPIITKPGPSNQQKRVSTHTNACVKSLNRDFPIADPQMKEKRMISSDSRSPTTVSHFRNSDKTSTELEYETPSRSFSKLHGCNQCDFMAGSSDQLTAHKYHKHCRNDLVGASPENVTESLERTHNQDSGLRCDICGFVAKNSGALGNHKSRHKSPENKPGAVYLTNSDHFKIIYDCPRCIKISFKNFNIMTRHLTKRHLGETFKPVTRVTCAHCEFIFPQTEDPEVYKTHLKDTHKLEIEEYRDVMGLAKIKSEPIDSEDLISVNGMLPINGTTINDHQMETASNADTERASSRGSFAASSPSDKVTGTIKQSRLSQDDDATIEADLSKVKREIDESSMPHQCAKCNYQTSQSHFLKRHSIACHSNGTTEEPFLCKFCNFSTAHRSTIKSHLVMVHRDTSTKINECFRNIEDISRIFELDFDRDTFTSVEGKLKRKRKARSEPCTSKSTEDTTSFSQRKSTKTSGSQERIKKASLSSATNKPSKNQQRFEVAFRLKKAALAKQRRKTDTCLPAYTSTKSPKVNNNRHSANNNVNNESSSLHTRKLSPRASKKDDAKNGFRCRDCTYVAKSKAMYEKHVLLHNSCEENKLALCELCGVVKLKSSMFYHMKKHDEDAKDTNGSTPNTKTATKAQ